MKKTILATSAALVALAAPAGAADLYTERQLGLIVSGVVDQWTGIQIIDDGDDDDTVFTNGGEGRLSLPLGDNLSVQSDVKYEYNSNALEEPFSNDVFGPRYSFQGATHFSWRDPSSFLFGIFGGAGASSFGAVQHDVRFVGGEAQIYLDNITLYGQGGYVDFQFRPGNALPVGPLLDDGLFARGVLRWFPTSDSRIQIEGTYLNIDLTANQLGGGEMEAFSASARYDFTLDNLPIIGDTPFYVAYRGTFRDNCAFGDDVDDHTFMVGTSYSFSGDLLTVDRQGATLDTPDFNYSCVGGFNQISDRRLKTDVVALGKTEDGIKLYSWKYKSDLVTTWVGVMAQDLETTHPEALVTASDGFYRVNYSGLGVRMMTLEQWNARQL